MRVEREGGGREGGGREGGGREGGGEEARGESEASVLLVLCSLCVYGPYSTLSMPSQYYGPQM